MNIDRESVKVFARWLRSLSFEFAKTAIMLIANDPDALRSAQYSAFSEDDAPDFIRALAAASPGEEAKAVDEARIALYGELEEFARGEG